MEFPNGPTDIFMRNTTVPLGCLESKQGSRLVIYRSRCTCSVFQKALASGGLHLGYYKHTADSLDTLLLNAAGLLPLALAGEPPP